MALDSSASRSLKKMPPTRGSAAVEEDTSIRLIKCLLKHYTFIVLNWRPRPKPVRPPLHILHLRDCLYIEHGKQRVKNHFKSSGVATEAGWFR